MKNTIKVLGIIALVAIIGFSMAACAPNNPDPKPENLSGDITISPSGPVSKNTELTATYSGTEYVNYQWNKDGSAIPDATYYKYTPTAAGSYTVTVSGYDDSKTSAAVTVTAQTWTEISAFNGVTVYQTFYSLAAAKLFAVGSKGKIMTSDDNGGTWTTVASTFGTSNIRGIAYGAGIGYVAVGENGKMAYSSASNGGVTWTAVTDTKLTNYINGIAYSKQHGWTGGNLVAVGSGGGIAYSANGTTWTAVTDSPFTSAINAIAYGDIVKNNIGVDRLVAVGNDGKIAYSDDHGVTWTEVEDSTFGTSDITKIVSNNDNDKFIAVGFSGKMATSTDGITWTAVADSTFGTENTSAIMAIDCYVGTKFIAGGFSKMAITNDGGATWEAITITTGDILIYSIYGTNGGALLGVSNKMLFVSDLF